MVRRLALGLAFGLAFAVLALAPALAEDPRWVEPKDGVLTEKQADSWILATGKIRKAQLKALEDLDAAGKRKATALELGEISQRLDRDVEAIWKECGLADKPEHEWVGKQLTDAWSALAAERLVNERIAEVMKDLDEKAAATKKAHDEVTAAQKSGRRPMTAEERAAAVEQAKGELKDAEAGRKDAEVAVADAKKQVTDAEAALKAAGPDEREQAQANLQSAREVFNALQDNALEAARKVDQARRKAQDPDRPTTQEEKDALAADLADREKSTQDEADAAAKKRDQMKTLADEQKAKLAKERAKLPAKNMEIARARFDKIDLAFKQALDPHTQPPAEPKK